MIAIGLKCGPKLILSHCVTHLRISCSYTFLNLNRGNLSILHLWYFETQRLCSVPADAYLMLSTATCLIFLSISKQRKINEENLYHNPSDFIFMPWQSVLSSDWTVWRFLTHSHFCCNTFWSPTKQKVFVTCCCRES